MARTAAQITDPSFVNKRAWTLRWVARRQSSKLAEKALQTKLGTPTDRRRNQGYALRTLAWQSKWHGNLGQCQVQCLKALARLSKPEDMAARAAVHSILGSIHYNGGRTDLALASVEDGLDMVSGAAKSAETLVDLLVTKSSLQRYCDKPQASLETLRRALDMSDAHERARVHHNIARTLIHDRKPDDAMAHALSALVAARAHGNEVVLPYALEAVGLCHLRLDTPDRARNYLRDAVAIGLRDGDHRILAQARFLMSEMEAALGNPKASLVQAQRGLCTAKSGGFLQWQLQYHRRIALLAETLGDYPTAMASWRAIDDLKHKIRA